MTWHSSAEYYRLLNEVANERLGGLHSARCVLASVDMAPIDELMASGRWDEAGALLARDAQSLQAAGAELFILATNSLHNVWDTIVAGLAIPAIHIADPTGDALGDAGHERVALLGTRYTMELPFLRGRLEERYGVEVVVPGEADRELVHRAVFEELALGVFSDTTRAAFVDLVGRLGEEDASAVVLGCTEFGLLLSPDDVELPLFDTARLHATAAVDQATRPT